MPKKLAKKTKKPAVAKKAAPVKKVAPAKKAAPTKKAAPKLGALRLERPRSPFGAKLSALRDFEKKQLERILRSGASLAKMCAQGLPTAAEMIAGDGSELRAIEIVDVVDTESNETRFQLVVVPFENAALFADQTADIVLSIMQNTIEPEDDAGESLGRDLVLAWREGLGRLPLKSDHFYPE
jgi:hypothetical protein